ncbi:metallophosphoesterase [Parapedobacter lycopersici]|uniref:metallophosphoesterase family protein n=1 Tax=Parapedobacter lycopersici TaxID=1864939 RepID=UPI00333F7ED7
MRFKFVPLLLCWLFTASAFTAEPSYRQSDDRLPLRQHSQDKPLKIMVISDLNDSYGSTTYSNEVAAVINKVKVIKPDIILCGGDMVAGQKASLTEAQLTAMWEGFDLAVLKPIDSLKIPFGFTVGNHDASPSYQKDRAAASQFWNQHIEATNLTFVDRTHYPFYFSYKQNNVFFISWDASSETITPEMLDWMEGQLKSGTAKQSRLRILLGHLPLYAIVADKNKPGEVIAEADRTLDFFKENGVDIYISGHQHAYFPARKNGVVLFNSGCLGGGPRPILGHDEGPTKAYAIIDIPATSAARFEFNAFVPGTDSLINLQDLPESVLGFNGLINRIDITD